MNKEQHFDKIIMRPVKGGAETKFLLSPLTSYGKGSMSAILPVRHVINLIGLFQVKLSEIINELVVVIRRVDIITFSLSPIIQYLAHTLAFDKWS